MVSPVEYGQAHYVRSSPDATQTRAARNLGRFSFRLHTGETLAQAIWNSQQSSRAGLGSAPGRATTTGC